MPNFNDILSNSVSFLISISKQSKVTLGTLLISGSLKNYCFKLKIQLDRLCRNS